MCTRPPWSDAADSAESIRIQDIAECSTAHVARDCRVDNNRAENQLRLVGDLRTTRVHLIANPGAAVFVLISGLVSKRCSSNAYVQIAIDRLLPTEMAFEDVGDKLHVRSLADRVTEGRRIEVNFRNPQPRWEKARDKGAPCLTVCQRPRLNAIKLLPAATAMYCLPSCK